MKEKRHETHEIHSLLTLKLFQKFDIICLTKFS
jgi:hypothetical protein